MAFCTDCGTPLPAASAACPRCGASVEVPAAPSPSPANVAPAPPQWGAAPPTPPPAWNAGPAAPPQWGTPPPNPPAAWPAGAVPGPAAPAGPPQGWNGAAVTPPPAAPPWNAPPGPPPAAWGPPPAPPGGFAPPAPNLAGVQSVLQQMINDIRSFNVRWVVPVDTALSPALLQNRTVWVMLLFGFFPLLAPQLKLIESAEDVVRTLLIYCALAWAGYFYYFVCKRSVDYRIGGGVMLFTAFIGIRLVFILWALPGFSSLHALTEPDRDLVAHLIGFVFGVGVIEELTKAVPVLVLAYALHKVEKPLDGIFFGAMSGLGFGIAEGIVYILRPDANVTDVLLRVTTLPFMHALWAATVGYFIGLAQINRTRGPALVLLGFAVSIVGHGVYDALNSSLSLLVAALSYLLFSAYLERSQQMIDELQRAERVANRESALHDIFRQTYLPGLQATPPAAPPQEAP